MITIQNNKRQRRILIFDSAFNLEDSNDFLREMFDARYLRVSLLHPPMRLRPF